MYDPVTTSLIQSVPALTGLDRVNLPRTLTAVYARLVSARLLMREQAYDADLATELLTIRRLANTFESYAAVLTDRPDREAAAFVAGTAHGLLVLDRAAGTEHRTLLSDDQISPDISACLLFLASGHFADASEVARKFRIDTEAGPIRTALLRALQGMANGEVGAALRAAEKHVSPSSATDTLYAEILDVVARLLVVIRDGGDGLEILQALHSTQVRSVSTIEAGADAAPLTVSVFAGPHHLATLLLQATRSLLVRRMSTIPTPLGVDEAKWKAGLSGIVKSRPYLWKSHEDAVESGFLDPGVSAVLSFPTGSGKSVMAELKISSTLACGRDVLYLAPTHALVTQATRDLTARFPDANVSDTLVEDAVYAETGDPRGSVAVMTPERALTILSTEADALQNTGLVVMDECHLLHPSQRDRARRSIDAMLCLLAAVDLAPNADVLLMSAMVANHIELSEWIAELTGRRCEPLKEDWKPTRQVRGCVVFEQQRVSELNAALLTARKSTKSKSPGAALKRTLRATPNALFSLRQTWATHELEDYALLPLMARDVQLGASKNWSLTANRNEVSADVAREFAARGMRVLVFAENPKTAGSLADTIAAHHGVRPTLSAVEQRLMEISTEEAGGLEHVLGLTSGGAVVHHGLLLPSERQLVESVYRSADSTSVVLVGTPTLAQGINLPAEVVIVSGDDRYDPVNKKPTPLGPEELLNAVARAGRAGHASVGVVLVVPGGLVSFDGGGHHIAERWFKLQADVFSKMDQCLTVDDPLELVMDVIHSGVQRTGDANYFLNRLPLDSEAARRFLGRSLGAHRARKALSTEAFRSKTESVIAQRIPASPPREEWAGRLAMMAGISVDLASELASEVLDNVTQWQVSSVTDVVSRFFEWVTAEPGRASALMRIPDLTPDGEAVPKLSLDQLKMVTFRWLGGASLKELEEAAESKVGIGCTTARKLVLRTIPEVAYGIGVVAHAYRLATGGDGTIPLALAVGAECVKRGLSTPEQLAFFYVKRGDCSRAESARRISSLDVDASDTFDSFPTVRKRVEAALETDKLI
jgi:DEAD/DEAH box helicase